MAAGSGQEAESVRLSPLAPAGEKHSCSPEILQQQPRLHDGSFLRVSRKSICNLIS